MNTTSRKIDVERLRDLAERETSLLTTVIEYLPVGFYMGDSSCITLCNRMELQLLGFETLSELQTHFATLAEQLKTRAPETGVRLRPEEDPFARALSGDACMREVAYTHRQTGEEVIVECAAIPVRENGGIVAALVINTDITARRQIETEAKAKQQFYEITASSELNFAEKVQTLLQLGCHILKLNMGIFAHVEGEQYTVLQVEAPPAWEVLPGTVFSLAETFCEKTVTAAYPISVEDVASSPEWRVHPAYRKSQLEAYLGTAILVSGMPYGTLNFSSLTSHRQLFTSGEREWVQLVARWIGHELQQSQANQALRQSEERYRTLFHAIDEGFCVIEVLFDADDKPIDYRFLEINSAFEGQTGLHEAIGKRMRELAPDLETYWFDIYGRVALTGEPIRFINEARALDERWFDVYAFRLGGGQSRKVAILFRDITERKQSERTLQERTGEIEALNVRLKRSMTETHHRVKNNLQVIAAMIEMQVLEHKGEHTIPIEEFVRLKTHVHTLAIVHDLLTKNIKESEDAQRISTKSVLQKLLPMLQRTAWKQTVHYAVDDEVELTSKQCIALSLVLNELVSNALKHGKKEASVYFTADAVEATLAVQDDGPGFPDGFDAQQAANTGLELIDSLIRIDLGGQIRYQNRPEGGGEVRVTFPLPKQDV